MIRGRDAMAELVAHMGGMAEKWKVGSEKGSKPGRQQMSGEY